MLSRLIKYLKNNDNGASLIEFALITPFLLMLVVGIIEFGWIYNGYISLNGATREGARIASIYKAMPGDPDYTNYIIDEVMKHETNTLEITNIRVTSVEVGASAYRTNGVRVEADGSISLLLGGISFLPIFDESGNFNFSAQTTMSLEPN